MKIKCYTAVSALSSRTGKLWLHMVKHQYSLQQYIQLLCQHIILDQINIEQLTLHFVLLANGWNSQGIKVTKMKKRLKQQSCLK